jgi:hypothetical protein
MKGALAGLAPIFETEHRRSARGGSDPLTVGYALRANPPYDLKDVNQHTDGVGLGPGRARALRQAHGRAALAVSSKSEIAFSLSRVRPMLSKPSRRQR